MNDIEALHKRNSRVEADKAWETSKTRRAVIAIGTYVIACAYLAFLQVPQFYLHAAVPPVAFLISTLSLPIIKTWWVETVYQKS